RQMRRAIAIDESGAIADGKIRPDAPRQDRIDAGGKCVALIVVEEAKRFPARFIRDQAAGDSTVPLGMLVRESQAPGTAASQERRLGADLPAADAGVFKREREEDVRVPQRIVIEEVPCARTEVRNVEDPASDRYRQSEFALFVALATQRKEAAAFLVVTFARTFRKEFSGDREERRSLVVASIEGPRHPAQFGNAKSGPDPGISGIVVDLLGFPGFAVQLPWSLKVRHAKAAVDGQPVCDPVLV